MWAKDCVGGEGHPGGAVDFVLEEAFVVLWKQVIWKEERVVLGIKTTRV